MPVLNPTKTLARPVHFLLLGLLLVHMSATAQEGGAPEQQGSPIALATAMARQTMQGFPDPWLLRESDGAYRWSYTIGLVLFGMEKLQQQTGDQALLDYIQKYADHYIDAEGRIATLEVSEFNIDSINSGKLLFALYTRTDDPRYRLAMDELHEQLQWQPRTHSGGFWHKLKYPWQVWLDGLYMALPFYAQYERYFGSEPATYDDIVSQFTVIRDRTLDLQTGLLYHAWDESRLQPWANEDTGQSPAFWSRAMGWYAMALVDTLELLPANHPGQQQLGRILNDLIDALILFQHESGLWYQVTDQFTDQGPREGNWLEASGSAMFVYAIAKGVRLGVLDTAYARAARKGYDGIVTRLISTDADGTIHLNDICRSAGLGGVPYRDGSYEYYVSTDRVSDDAHGVGAFLLASTEIALLQPQ